jgi:hypothetical protein
MTVIDMVRKALEEAGYDGLYNCDLGCACINDDLRPCDSDFSECKPGYKHDTPNDPDHDWIISEVKK